jgi:anti-sigma regulatory factor (Ser/Thr protein kinase)
VLCELTRDEARIIVRDEGPGFDVASLPDPRDPARIALASGRGILLMRSFLDEVGFNATGNQVTLVKRRSAPRPSEVVVPHECPV